MNFTQLKSIEMRGPNYFARIALKEEIPLKESVYSAISQK